MNTEHRRRWSAVLMAALAGLSLAAAFLPLELDARLEAAEFIAVGEIVEVSVVARSGEPWTLVQMRVERWFKAEGNVVDPETESDSPLAESITAAFWGGAVDGAATLTVAGMPTFAVGERVLWFLHEPDAGLAAPTVGVSQGIYRSSERGWRGDDGSLLSLDERGELQLDGVGGSDQLIFEALEARLAGAGR